MLDTYKITYNFNLEMYN